MSEFDLRQPCPGKDAAGNECGCPVYVYPPPTQAGDKPKGRVRVTCKQCGRFYAFYDYEQLGYPGAERVKKGRRKG